ncbi:guanine nucleotide exchange factor DBS-like isoform X2 [Ctenocephalides felis]|uniref:guanine nucleotide exchange factor DBS-like isoform X2 n=1 Tax=Ctenocephalides felis TaxID=7515 RepID=UPI000E6E525E|nr:guanine nucleotide exchange factor DBS-like isoform X2 [Ctenocephalides felis]
MGFHLIIDRREDKWSSVKAVLMKISIFFPGVINVAYVLRPAGFFQKAISEVSNKLFKEEFRFRVEVCSCLEELHEFIDKSQLTSDLGGDLKYSHIEWIQQRISLEKFSMMTQEISVSLDQFMRQIHETMFPNSAEATERLLQVQGEKYNILKEDIMGTTKHGYELLQSIREPGGKHIDRIGNVSAVERLLVQLEETEKRFDEFWNAHSTKLIQCLKLRRFEQDFRELQSNFDAHLRVIEEMIEVGETVSHVDELIQQAQEFQHSCRSDIERADIVINLGKKLLVKSSTVPHECVEPKCTELNRVRTALHDKITKRLETLHKWRELMEQVERANQWCAKGVELLTSQHIEKCSSSLELAEQSLHEIQDFKQSKATEFQSCLQESSTLESKPLVKQVLKRINDVSLMCDKRITTLQKLCVKPLRPVQTVIPEPAVPIQPSGGAPHYPIRTRPVRKKSTSKEMGHERKQRPQSGECSAEYWGSVQTEYSSDSEISTRTYNSSSSSSQTSEPSKKAYKVQQDHVISELLETERVYVNEIGSILKGYRDEILSVNLNPLVPQILQTKCDILFGNLDELHTFHKDVFLKDLENCISTTELVAMCFVEKKDTFFKLYSFYCQNIPRSEQLRENLGEANSFLQVCQQKLGHKLPLAAYLLKPVQRITKYQLLLKDLLRTSQSDSCSKELKEALDCMLIVLKCVNDSMLQIAITGFPMDLTKQGELLLHGSFSVWTDSKKDIRLRLKTQQRHIFLYHNVMLFCKEATKGSHSKTTYHYKHDLKMSEIGLTESVKGDPRKFEVWLQGRQEVHTIMAATMEQKQIWVAEIKRVLLNQLQELKGEKIKEYSAMNHKMLRQVSSWETSVQNSQNVALRTMSCEGSFCNNAVGTSGSHSVSSSEKEDQEGLDLGLSSSEYSNSEEEDGDKNQPPSGRYVVLADYCAVGHSQVSMKEGETVELLKVGCAGWWFVKLIGSGVDGWAPAAYLESLGRKSKCSNHSREKINGNE